MTVFDSSITLYQWFRDNDVFCMEDHFQRAIVLTEDEGADKASFSAALGEFEQSGLVARESFEGKEYYILKKTLDSVDQDVSVNHPLALKISIQINEFCERVKDFQDVCDPAEIHSRDLLNLTFMIDYFIEKENSQKD
jgi:hypothetical protein